MIPGLILTCAGILAAWQPVETHPWTAVVLTGLFLALIPWAWNRTSGTGIRSSAGVIAATLVFIVAGQAGGWSRTEAISQVFLAGAMITTVWLASRCSPNDRMVDIFAVGLISLATWGLWQSLGGLEHLQGLTETLPEHLRAGASARIGRGRAFASLLLPSHLAVVLATALPLLMVRINRSLRGSFFAIAFIAGLMGLLATRSPVGVALAIGACGVILAGDQRKTLYCTLACGFVAIGLVVGSRPDILRLEPFALRIDNWSSAIWVWSTAPFTGVGLGGFGQAAQAVPWHVGNHPVHAHSMPLEFLADLGLLGFAAWFACAVWLLYVAKRIWPLRPEIAAALLVVPAHNLMDFSIYTSAVALPWAILFGWSLALTAEDSQPRTQLSTTFRWIPVLAGALAVGVAILAFTADAFEQAARGEAPFETRFDWAKRAAILTPWNSEATDLVGMLALESGHRNVAQEALWFLERRRWQQPRSSARAQLTGRLKTLVGDPVSGATELWKAQNGQPYETRRRVDFETAAQELGGPQRVGR